MLKFRHVSFLMIFLITICISFSVQASGLDSMGNKEAGTQLLEVPKGSVSWDGHVYSSSLKSDANSAPQSPTLLSPADGAFAAGTSITFRWEAVTRAEDYQLRIVRQSDNTVHFSGFVGNITSYNDSYFSDDGEIYCWQVSAGNYAGWSSYSDPFCFTNDESTVPPEPKPIYPTDGSYVTGTSITFSWEPSPGATHYIINVFRPDMFMQFCFEDDITGTSHTCSYFPDDGTEFEWYVAAANEHEMSHYAYGGSFFNGEPQENPLPGVLMLLLDDAE